MVYIVRIFGCLVQNQNHVGNSTKFPIFIFLSLLSPKLFVTRKDVLNETYYILKEISYDEHFYLGESTIYDSLMSNFSVGSKNVPLSFAFARRIRVSIHWFILSLNGSSTSSKVTLVNMSIDKSYRSCEFTSHLWPYRQISMARKILQQFSEARHRMLVNYLEWLRKTHMSCVNEAVSKRYGSIKRKRLWNFEATFV